MENFHTNSDQLLIKCHEKTSEIFPKFTLYFDQISSKKTSAIFQPNTIFKFIYQVTPTPRANYVTRNITQHRLPKSHYGLNFAEIPIKFQKTTSYLEKLV